MSVGVIIPARNEEKSIPHVLNALLSQHHRPEQIVVVDDGSSDATGRIARQMGCHVVRLPPHKESWVGTPLLAKVYNAGVSALHEVDYMLIVGADTILPPNYIERLLVAFKRDRRLVVASGVVDGEGIPVVPRGTGRMIRMAFFKKYVGRFPTDQYCWESYPIYLALALGFRTLVDANLVIHVMRRTRRYKACYGFAMRELNYFPPLALLRCVLATIREAKTGSMMMKTYLFSPFKPKNTIIKAYMRRQQAKTLLQYCIKPTQALRRIAYRNSIIKNTLK